MEPDEPPLTENELRSLKRNLSMLSTYSVQEMYREAHKRCRMDGDRLPSPKAIQQLVTAWKQLWSWRKH
ncbi:MAG: hypothetical protein ABJF23_29155 [Bryobacteraceae bacterium]